MAIIERHRGRPRATWIGRFGAFVSSFTAERLAGELEVDVSLVGRWARGDYRPTITRAIAIVEIAKARGADLSLEDLYASDFARIRARIRNGQPPL